MDAKLTSKMTWLQILLVIAFCFLAAFFCQHNDKLYHQTIFQVSRVENGKAVKMTDEFQNVDHYHSQMLYGKITNGKHVRKNVKIKIRIVIPCNGSPVYKGPETLYNPSHTTPASRNRERY